VTRVFDVSKTEVSRDCPPNATSCDLTTGDAASVRSVPFFRLNNETTKGKLPNLRYCFVRTTPSPTLLRCFSGHFRRAFSACCFVLNGLDNG
jgi:hypothetical protein